MIQIKVGFAGRRLTVRFPDWVDEVEIVLPSEGVKGEGGKSRKPTIVLTDRF